MASAEIPSGIKQHNPSLSVQIMISGSQRERSIRKAPQSKLEAREIDQAHESLVDLSRRKDAKPLTDLLRSARNHLKDRTRRLFVNHIKRSSSARLYLFGILREVLGSNLIALDCDVKTCPRYTPAGGSFLRG